ncbi:MAG: DUF3179 domain-containing (seleno)protein, partial [Gammaproteobacteria bacterium]
MTRHSSKVGVRLAIVAALLAFPQEAAAAPADWRAEWPRTDFTKHVVDLSEVRSGGPPKDGIPSIDRPQFKPVGEVSDLAPTEPVIVVSIRDDT